MSLQVLVFLSKPIINYIDLQNKKVTPLNLFFIEIGRDWVTTGPIVENYILFCIGQPDSLFGLSPKGSCPA
jgi:hypothetical protein